MQHMADESADSIERTERLTETIHALARKEHERRPDPPSAETPSLSYQSLTRRTALVAILGSVGAALFSGSAAAAPSGTYPASGDDPLARIRVDRIEYSTRTSQPSAPPSGTVLAYVRDGDLP